MDGRAYQWVIGGGSVKGISLDYALDKIVDDSVAILQAEAVVGGSLDGVKTIVKGDKYRGKPELPVIWVWATTVIPSNANMSIKEAWVLQLLVTVFVKGGDTETSYKQSISLAARARSLLKKNPNLHSPSFVKDVSGGRFDATGRWNQNESISGSAFTVDVLFYTNE